ncbi:CRISPR-associated endonuclease Cas2 [Candidatus Gracilibacteria bacterium]|nr:CRISPR-associated endonuclease Cas2 [Thermales bacterium]NJL96680.1 CRISPR-associated endonuclease Cas2 [Candidatus Gracilibacteria bacterium]NJS41636.1 CRISPR-associated endonuclease Cas2 [Candidatus Gracilibacteria bacterium]
MLIVTYDFSNNKIRTKFHKFLKKYGHPLQYSVFEIKNSPRILNIIMLEIEKVYKPKFTLADSILIIPISLADTHKIRRYGYSVQEEKELIWFD